MFYGWWEGFLSTEKCEHFRSFLSVRTSVFASDIVVPEKNSTGIPAQIKSQGSDCTGWR